MTGWDVWVATHEVLIGAVVTGAALVVAGALLRARRERALVGRLDALAHAQERGERVLREELAQGRRELAGQTHHLREEVGGSLRAVGETVEKRIEVMRGAVDLRLGQIQAETQKRLEEMRATVDEKLQGTLEQRLGAAFAQVSTRLEAVHKGLGEMQTLAVGVGDLKKVLTNVRARGSFGETRLEALLEDALVRRPVGAADRDAPGLGRARGRGDPAAGLRAGEPLWLPIDAKFPQEDYARLRRRARARRRRCGRGGRARARGAAQAGGTCDARQVRVPAAHDRVRGDLPADREPLCRGPPARRADRCAAPRPADHHRRPRPRCSRSSRLLQMGFRTLAIQERSQEVWQLLGAVKTQFGKFGDLLGGVQKKLDEASNKIGEASQKITLHRAPARPGAGAARPARPRRCCPRRWTFPRSPEGRLSELT